jgi:DNA uptake protein ComE-like DNA-binding protein
MHPYLLLPEKIASKNAETKLFTFDPNTLNAEGWQKLGFTEKQTTSILNYRDKILKGSFKNLEDIKKCFVISEEKFNQIKPYISLSVPAKAQEQETNFANIDLNKITFKQLIEFGFDERAAGSFVGFRKKLGGFANTQQMLDTYNIDKDLMEKLIKTAKFSTESVTKYTLIDAPEDWLKNHPYFKYSADKIIFYRTSYQDENKIWKALKLKPEYETKMRWYLK